MQDVQSTEREAARDIFFGQVVINWARWFIIVAGVVLVLTSADSTGKLAVGIVPVVAMMALNFYLHGRRLAEHPANAGLVATSSVIDLLVVTAIVALGPGSGVFGLDNQFYLAYYPVILAFAFVMPRASAIGFTAGAMVLYAVACVLAGLFVAETPNVLTDFGVVESLVTRLIVMAAVGGLGTYFWRIQRSRRRAALGGVEEASV